MHAITYPDMANTNNIKKVTNAVTLTSSRPRRLSTEPSPIMNDVRYIAPIKGVEVNRHFAVCLKKSILRFYSMGLKDFKLSQQLGKGTFGCVYKVRRKSDGIAYALKEVGIKELSHKEREDAVNEIRILASIDHYNVLTYMEGFVEKDKLYIVRTICVNCSFLSPSALICLLF
jgi:serine/threonine protein kinase